MLSAVAARKAALSATISKNQTEQSNCDASSGSTPVKPKRIPSNLAQKRKTSPSAPSSNARALKKPNSQRRGTNELQKASTSAAPPLTGDSDDQGMLVDDEPRPDAQTLDVVTPRVTPKRARAWSPSRPMDDSSDEESLKTAHLHLSSAVNELPHPPTHIPTYTTDDSVVLSTFSPIEGENFFLLNQEETHQSLCINSASIALIFRPQDTLCLLGTYTVHVLAGSISFQGSYLLPSQAGHHVFAPSSSPLPVLRHHMSPPGEHSLISRIPQQVQNKLGPQDCLLVLRELRTGVEALGNIQPKFAGVFHPNTRADVASAPMHDLGLRGVYLVRYSGPSHQPFVLPETWESALDSACSESTDGTTSRHKFDAPRFLVRGPKKTGKSTFARTLLNRLLIRYARVAYLECDLGQSEFTPAGMVALNIATKPLFGPAFTHPTIPHLAHFIGSTTPRDSPALYISAIENCLQTYRLDVERASDIPEDDISPSDPRMTDIIPLIVNTMGWTKGLGVDLNTQIGALVDPSAIFEFTSPYDRPSTSHGGVPPPSSGASLVSMTMTTTPTHILTPISSALTSQYTAAEHRSLNLISYLHAQFPTPSSPISRNITAHEWSPKPLLTCAPYEISWALAFPGGLIIATAGGDDVVPSEAAHVLPGALVALVAPRAHAATTVYTNSIHSSVQVGERESENDMDDALGYQQGRPPPSPEESHCIGLALIRGISLPLPVTSTSTFTPSSGPGPAAPPDPSSSTSGQPNTGPGAGTGALAQVLTPIPGVLLGSAQWAVKGSLELPIWEMFPATSTGASSAENTNKEAVAGVPLPRVPFLRWTGSAAGHEKSGEIVYGGERRRVRRNLMRKAQM